MLQFMDLLVHAPDSSMEGGTREELDGGQFRGRFHMGGVRTRAVNQTCVQGVRLQLVELCLSSEG
jgi:hypothetical protein